MADLRDLRQGARARGGVLGPDPVELIHVAYHGTTAATIRVRDAAGRLAEHLLMEDQAGPIELYEEGAQWTFDAPAADFLLTVEAHRIRLAHLFDPYMAVHSSAVEPLPHQITAVYKVMLDRQPLRFLLADDPGAGKTIMAGLLIKELMARGVVARCMIVAPGSLVEQWQDELDQKFGLAFDIITNETIAAARTGNPWAERSLVIARLDHIARNPDHHDRIRQTDWDLVVIDEAHKCAAHFYGNEVDKTLRYKLAELLGEQTHNLLLLTATPHSGDDANFQLFMALLDADRFAGKPRAGTPRSDTTDMMRRMVKEKLLRFDGTRLFPERRAYSVSYPLSDGERRLYNAVTEYVREEWNRADRLEGDGKRRNVVGFALTILQRRLASSPEAIYRSLQRRRARLEDNLKKLESGQAPVQPTLPTVDEEYDPDDMPDEEREEAEQTVVDQATAALTIAELREEVRRLGQLEALAEEVRNSETDKKWEELRGLLHDAPEMFDADGHRRKVIIFSEHRDTLTYLHRRITSFLGRPEAIVVIHGGMGRNERRHAQELFTQDKETTILIATDAAGEGINLQRAHLMVNYDLPWNPNRIEQRFGRIHRIGQTDVCHMWNLIASDTREGEVFARLFTKLEAQSKALGGQVFDVLGEAFSDRSLRELLVEAVRYGDSPEVKARLFEQVEQVSEDVKRLADDRAITSDNLLASDVEEIRRQMAEANARRLQPYHIEAFVRTAFESLGGRIAPREPGRFEIAHVPAEIREHDRATGHGDRVLRRYERITFDPSLVRVPDKPLAALLAPGHPLMDALTDLIIKRNRAALAQGTILVSADPTETPAAMVLLEHAIQDGRTDSAGMRRVISRRLQFISVPEEGPASFLAGAPHLDLRTPTEEEAALVADLAKQEWLQEGLDERAHEIAIRDAVPGHLSEVSVRMRARIAKERREIEARLSSEIDFWDHRAAELQRQEEGGRRQPKMNADYARNQASELHERLKRRRAELIAREEISATVPVLVGATLVVPAGLIERRRGLRDAAPSTYARERDVIERKAVDAVLAMERKLGRDPHEQPRNNPGFDVLSWDANGEAWYIEVKGRVQGADDVTITRNEVLTSLNTSTRFILAIAEVSDDACRVWYRPGELPDIMPGASVFDSVNYPIRRLLEGIEEMT